MTLLQRIKTPFTEPAAEEPPAARPRFRTVGEVLRERRSELGMQLDTIGDDLRIKPSYLAAIEQGRSQDLPGTAYAIGFVRAYANHLGLDPDKVVDRFRLESSGLQARQDLSLPVPLGERSLPGAAMLLVALILALCGYGTWYYLSTGDRSRPERVAAVPATLRGAPPLPGAPSTSTTAAPPSAATSPAEPSPSKSPEPAPAPNLANGLPNPAVPSSDAALAPDNGASGPVPSAITSPTGLVASSTSVAPTVPQPPPAPQGAVPAAPATPPSAQASAPAIGTSTKPVAAGAAATASKPTSVAAVIPPPAAAPAAASVSTGAAPSGHVDIKALADCWIQIRGPDQAIVFSRVLKSGETYHVPSRSGLYLRTGNAGALEISVDGKSAPPIGGIGAMRRNVTLEPDALVAGTAVQG